MPFIGPFIFGVDRKNGLKFQPSTQGTKYPDYRVVVKLQRKNTYISVKKQIDGKFRTVPGIATIIVGPGDKQRDIVLEPGKKGKPSLKQRIKTAKLHKFLNEHTRISVLIDLVPISRIKLWYDEPNAPKGNQQLTEIYIFFKISITFTNTCNFIVFCCTMKSSAIHSI